jgi:hypothetical protein
VELFTYATIYTIIMMVEDNAEKVCWLESCASAVRRSRRRLSKTRKLSTKGSVACESAARKARMEACVLINNQKGVYNNGMGKNQNGDFASN